MVHSLPPHSSIPILAQQGQSGTLLWFGHPIKREVQLAAVQEGLQHCWFFGVAQKGLRLLQHHSTLQASFPPLPPAPTPSLALNTPLDQLKRSWRREFAYCSATCVVLTAVEVSTLHSTIFSTLCCRAVICPCIPSTKPLNWPI